MATRTSTFLAFAALVLMAFGTATTAADSNVATWKLNLTKSTFNPGPAPKSQTVKIEPWGPDGVKFVADGVDADGEPTHWEFQAQYDSKFVPFKGNPDADMISYKRIDANTIESTTQVKGKPTIQTKAVVSADGKTRTVTQYGKTAQGEDVHNVVVYDKQ